MHPHTFAVQTHCLLESLPNNFLHFSTGPGLVWNQIGFVGRSRSPPQHFAHECIHVTRGTLALEWKTSCIKNNNWTIEPNAAHAKGKQQTIKTHPKPICCLGCRCWRNQKRMNSQALEMDIHNGHQHGIPISASVLSSWRKQDTVSQCLTPKNPGLFLRIGLRVPIPSLE